MQLFSCAVHNRGFLSAALPLLLLLGVQAEPVRITFLPPPLDGTLSAGVYTTDGKLVRVIANEARDEAFTVGLNGLMTNWDGKDDGGSPAPAGKYFVRGYAVGEIEVEGTAYHGNDWVDDDESLIVRDLRGIRLQRETLFLDAVTNSGSGILRMELETGARSFLVQESAPTVQTECAGVGGAVWKIEEGAVIQRKDDEILRQLALAEGDPIPFAIAASTERDEVFFLERNDRMQRLRGLRLRESKTDADGKPISEWEVFVEKTIHVQGSFADVAQVLGRTPPPVPEEKVRVQLIPNELLQVAPAALSVAIGFDDKGCYLKSADGLPLRRISDTPRLVWATLTREPDGSLTVFESDGAMVAEYRVRKFDQMMAFDAGAYEWAGDSVR